MRKNRIGGRAGKESSRATLRLREVESHGGHGPAKKQVEAFHTARAFEEVYEEFIELRNTTIH